MVNARFGEPKNSDANEEEGSGNDLDHIAGFRFVPSDKSGLEWPVRL